MADHFWLTLVMITQGYEIQAMAYAANTIIHEFDIDDAQFGLLLSTGFVGMGAGTAIAGPIADRRGRRPILLAGLLIVSVTLVSISTSGSMTELYTWHLLAGIGSGTTLTAVIVLLAEYSNARQRAFAFSIFAAGLAAGGVLGGLTAPVFIEALGWGGIFIFGSLLTMTVLIGIWAKMPESLVFLLTQNERARSDITQHRIHRICVKINLSAELVLDTESPFVPKRSSAGLSYTALFAKKYRVRTLRLWLLGFIMMGAYYFITLWTPQLLTREGMSDQQGITTGMYLLAGRVIGALIFGLASMRWNVRRVSSMFIFGSATISVIFSLNIHNAEVATVAAVLLGIMVGAMTPAFLWISTMSYGDTIRATGTGAVSTIGRLATILVPVVVGIALEMGTLANTLFGIVALGLVLAAVIIWNQPLGGSLSSTTGRVGADNLPTSRDDF